MHLRFQARQEVMVALRGLGFKVQCLGIRVVRSEFRLQSAQPSILLGVILGMTCYCNNHYVITCIMTASCLAAAAAVAAALLLPRTTSSPPHFH